VHRLPLAPVITIRMAVSSPDRFDRCARGLSVETAHARWSISRFQVIFRGGTLRAVTDGLAILAAWIEFGLVVGALAFVVLRDGTER